MVRDSRDRGYSNEQDSEDLMFAKEEAASLFQACWWGYVVRRALRRRHRAATRLQKVMRGRLARVEFVQQKTVAAQRTALRSQVQKRKETLKWLAHEKQRVQGLPLSGLLTDIRTRPIEAAIRIQVGWRLHVLRRARHNRIRKAAFMRRDAVRTLVRFYRRYIAGRKERSGMRGAHATRKKVELHNLPFELPTPDRVRELQERVNERRFSKGPPRTEKTAADLAEQARSRMEKRRREDTVKRSMCARRTVLRSEAAERFCVLRTITNINQIGTVLNKNIKTTGSKAGTVIGIDVEPSVLEEAIATKDAVLQSLRRRQWWKDLPQEDA